MLFLLVPRVTGDSDQPAISPASLGPTTVPTSAATSVAPAGAVEPGESIQGAIDRSSPGETIVIGPGTHRLQTLAPKSGQTILGTPGAILSGAVLLNEWQPSDEGWVAGTPPLSAEIFGQIETRVCVDETEDASEFPSGSCRTPYVLFMDDIWIPWSTDRNRISEGFAFLDVAKSRVYVGLNPTGRRVELAVTDFAIVPGSAPGVRLKDLTIEKYATPLQRATVTTGDDWRVENVVIRMNHAIGVRLGSHSTISNSRIYRNGHNGVGSRPESEGVQVLDNEIYENGVGGVDPLWGAGGSKFVQSVGLVVRGNHVYNNFGPGLWTDGSNVATLYEDNLVENNAGAGIMHELSHDATIRNNHIIGNGYRFNLGGIYVANSNNVEIYGNTLENNKVGVLSRQQDRGNDVENLAVHDNTIIKTMGDGYAAGLIEVVGDQSFFTTRNNKFWDNDYQISDEYARPYHWEGSQRTKSEWQQFGNDTNGTWTSRS